MLTLPELAEVLVIRYTPEELLEVLAVSSEDIVGSFRDHIEDNYERIHECVEADGFIDEGFNYE